MFSEQDKRQFLQKGISEKTVKKQLNIFRKGTPYPKITSFATVGNGILKFDETTENKYINFYNHFICRNKVEKFVPASGAASRMFKDLLAFLYDFSATIENYRTVKTFFENIEKFAFYEDLKSKISSNGFSLTKLLDNAEYKTILTYLLTEKGLNYSNKPKGTLAFHRYSNRYRTPIEEHLVEGALYANKNGETNIHFTLSDNHREWFEDIVNDTVINIAKDFSIKINVTYSFQNADTDTIAVNGNNEPFRNKDGTILFRPGGHGALIHNLNNIKGSLVFIKNIDNIVPDALKGDTVRYKQLLGGILLKFHSKLNIFIDLLNNVQTSKDIIPDLEQFLLDYYIINKIPDNLSSREKREFYLKFLNKPIRVCGMVRNEGEPGGGPYWVKSKMGNFSTLQILESSQINYNNSTQKKIALEATHFNPVDIVCWLKDYQYKKFNLTQFVDNKTYFISEKSKDGKKLKALELPGLWNGAMAHWLTIFVEVPISTFNPVKTINDLLRKNHTSMM